MRYRSGQHSVTAPSTSDLPKVTHSLGQSSQSRHGDVSVLSQGTDLFLLVLYPSPLVFHPFLLVISKPNTISKQTQSRS